nr:NAD(P)-dependent oxidoreductase [Candidatus Sigynarchaeota archaeon]
MDITTENELELDLSEPSPSTVEAMKRIDGDIAILGIGGKIGPSLGRMAARAIAQAGVDKKVFGISRFSEAGLKEKLESWNVKTISCDLLDRDDVAKLPQVPNVIFMAGRKFGTTGAESLTWAMNVLVPANVANHYRTSRIVAFSTGCVYPQVEPSTGGCTEHVRPEPVGEYAQSCLGRERMFEYHAQRFGTKTLLFRLNYAVDLRYGVLHDIATSIWNDNPVVNVVGHFNVIWQGDVNDWALQSLELCESPPRFLNVTGPETASIVSVAEMMGAIMNKQVRYLQQIPGNLCYLNNAAGAFSRFGYPRVTLQDMIRLQAQWIIAGNRSLNKPTHFEINDGTF